jgi:hypothetical protein
MDAAHTTTSTTIEGQLLELFREMQEQEAVIPADTRPNGSLNGKTLNGGLLGIGGGKIQKARALPNLITHHLTYCESSRCHDPEYSLSWQSWRDMAANSKAYLARRAAR